MAEASRTVRVSGLPTDVEDNRLKDKLFIHFLRSSNDGGEVDSVVIVKATPGSALVTFEDSRVAQSVIHRGQHTLQVDEKTYKVIATEHHTRLGPDEVILSLTAAIDCSQLPGGEIALKNLCKNHPDVNVNFISAEETCTLSGAYSKVQAALSQLLDCPEGFGSPESNDSTGLGQVVPRPQKTFVQESEDHKRRRQKPKEKSHLENPPEDRSSGSNGNLTPGGYSREDPGQSASAAVQVPPTSLEDFTLILDADMFQYLQKHCQKEYQDILTQCDVAAVDQTNQGLTTVFLQAAAGGRSRDAGADEQERLKRARNKITRLYQEIEPKVRRGQVLKILLPSKGELRRAMESLSVRHPKLLVNEDDHYIHVIGSSSDVSEAKQFLLNLQKVRDKGEEAAGPPKRSLYASGSSIRADEDGVPLTSSSTGGYPDRTTDQMLKSEESERRVGGNRQYKIAALFQDGGRGVLGTLPTDLSLRANSSPSRQTRTGPMLGFDVLSETAKMSVKAVSRAAAQNTGGDILFKSSSASPSFTPLQYKTPSNPDLMDVRPKTSTSSTGTTQGSTPLPTAGSGATLKRTSSFSGTSQKKTEVLDQRSEGDTSESTFRTRGRSSSFSGHTGREKQKVHTGEVTVPMLMWKYMKEAYGSRIDDLTSDVQMEERDSDNHLDLTVILRGANLSKVALCQLSLQKLIDSVHADFSVQNLPLSELGIANSADEILQACCSQLRGSLKKITIKFDKERLYLLGPEQMCTQVRALLQGVFAGASLPAHHHHHSTTLSSLQESTSAQMNEDQPTDFQFGSKSPVMPESKAGKVDGQNTQWETTYKKDFCEKELVNGSVGPPSTRKDRVVKEKVKPPGAEETDGQRSSAGSDASVGHANGGLSSSAFTDSQRAAHAAQGERTGREPASTETTTDQSRLRQEDAAYCCFCGTSGTSAMRTKCGAVMCSQCLQSKHTSCRVCHETEQKRCGIHGKIKLAKLSSSVEGHPKSCTTVIRYLIPDGIQGEDHPSPGEPFRGGEFMAFLPECTKTTKLLPRLAAAFTRGLTFTVTGKGTEAKVTWGCIPHKSNVHGGKANGYPDSTYLTRLSNILTQCGIEE